MRTTLAKLLGLFLLCGLLTGCFLRSLAGNVTGEEGEFAAELSGNSISANCNVSELPGQEGEVTCFYVLDFDPSFELETTSILISEFGLFGVLIDPLILQVPAGASNFSGVSQSGPTPDNLVITEVTEFDVQPGVTVSAEAGQKFVILEFQPDIPPTLPSGDPENGIEFDFNLSFDLPSLAPVDVKPMFAGKVEVNGETFYVPLLPCVTDFADVPAITIPVGQSPQNLLDDAAGLFDQNSDLVCDGQVYDFTAAQQPVPSSARPIPANHPGGLLLLAAALLTIGAFAIRRRR